MRPGNAEGVESRRRCLGKRRDRGSRVDERPKTYPDFTLALSTVHFPAPDPDSPRRNGSFRVYSVGTKRRESSRGHRKPLSPVIHLRVLSVRGRSGSGLRWRRSSETTGVVTTLHGDEPPSGEETQRSVKSHRRESRTSRQQRILAHAVVVLLQRPEETWKTQVVSRTEGRP